VVTALAALDALAREVLRLVPADGPPFPALSQCMDELRAQLTATDGAQADIGPLLDMLDDLLECRLRGLGWPAARR
jgi:hypothetical protein